MPPLVLVATACLAAAGPLLLYGLMTGRQKVQSRVVSNLERGGVTNLREIRLSASTRERALAPAVRSLASLGRRFTPGGSIGSLERKYILAGRPSSYSLERLLAAKIILGIVAALLILSRVSGGTDLRSLLLTVVIAVLLYFSPDVFITARASERQRTILHELPDVLDQTTICMEAGLGFEAAIARTSQGRDGPLAQEFIRMLQEVQVGIGRRQALSGLADRNDVQDLRHFVTALLQADHYGVPIARVLNDQAIEIRMKRRQRAEEAARKLPLKMLIPLALFVLPPLFIVLVGPAAMQLADTFANF